MNELKEEHTEKETKELTEMDSLIEAIEKTLEKGGEKFEKQQLQKLEELENYIEQHENQPIYVKVMTIDFGTLEDQKKSNKTDYFYVPNLLFKPTKHRLLVCCDYGDENEKKRFFIEKQGGTYLYELREKDIGTIWDVIYD